MPLNFDSAFYYPDRRAYWTPADFGLAHEDVYFTSEDGLSLHGWWLPARGAPRGVVVHCHGNAANISNHIALSYWLPHQRYHTFMFDYRGFGQSEGRVTRRGTVQDAAAALAWASRRARDEKLPLFVYGQSLGGAVAIVAAVEAPDVRAVVAESTFDRYRTIAARHAGAMFLGQFVGGAIASSLVSEGYDPIDHVAQLAPRPVLIITAAHDNICFPEFGEALFAAAREPKSLWRVENAGHLAILDGHEAELIRRITDFFDSAASRAT